MDWCVVQVIQVLAKKVSLNEMIEGPRDGTKQSKKKVLNVLVSPGARAQAHNTLVSPKN